MKQELGIGDCNRQRPAQLNDVVKRAIGAEQNTVIAESVDEASRLARGGPLRRAIFNQFDAQEKSRATDIAD